MCSAFVLTFSDVLHHTFSLMLIDLMLILIHYKANREWERKERKRRMSEEKWRDGRERKKWKEREREGKIWRVTTKEERGKKRRKDEEIEGGRWRDR